MVNYDEDEGDNERSTLLNPEQGRLTHSKNVSIVARVGCPERSKQELVGIRKGNLAIFVRT